MDVPRTSKSRPAQALERESLRNRMIATAHLRDGYSIREIAVAWKLHRATVHKIIRRMRESVSVISGKK